MQIHFIFGLSELQQEKDKKEDKEEEKMFTFATGRFQRKCFRRIF